MRHVSVASLTATPEALASLRWIQIGLVKRSTVSRSAGRGQLSTAELYPISRT